MDESHHSSSAIVGRVGRRPTIGLLNSRLERGFHRAAWLSVANAARVCDVNLIMLDGGVLHSPDDIDSPANILYSLVHPDLIDGLIVWSSSLGWRTTPQHMLEICERYRPIPLVSVGQALPGIPSIVVDNYQGVRDMVVHLIDVHGYQRIAFLSGPAGNREEASRYQGYQEALRAHGIPLDPRFIAGHSPHWDRKDGAAAIHLFVEERGLRPGLDFQVIVCDGDDMACGAIEALQERGIRVPEDVAVTGLNDDEEGRAMIPALTTVRQPIERWGHQAVEHLLRLMRGDQVPELLTLSLDLAVRRSCGCMSRSIAKAATPPAAITPQALSDTPALDSDDGHRVLGDIRHIVEEEAARFPFDLGDRLGVALLASIRSGPDACAARLHLSELTSALYRLASAGSDVAEWQDAISAMHHRVLLVLRGDQGMAARAESFWQQARVAVQEAAVQGEAYHRFLDNQRNHVLSQVNQEIQTANTWAELMDRVARGLQQLGIASGYLSLYEDPGHPIQSSRLTLAYNASGRIDVGEGVRFPSPRLFPPGLVPVDQRFSLAALPLYFRDEPLGFAILEVDPASSAICESLRQHLSTALEGERLRAQIRDAWQRAERANSLKSRFLATVGHELWTPLCLIIGTIEMLMRGNAQDRAALSDAQYRDLESIRASAQHLAHLIGDVLDLARSQVGELRLSYQLVDMKEVLQEVSQLEEPVARDKSLAWRMQLPNSPLVVNGDRGRLRQVVINLVANAIKFTQHGYVTCRAQVKEDLLTVTVSDTGMGVPADERESIFDEFSRSERATQRGYGGSGLGLAISRRIVDLHGGKIGVYSSGEEGAGSTFYFALPIAHGATDPASATDERSRVVVLLTDRPGGAARLIGYLNERGFQMIEVSVDGNPSWLASVMDAAPGAVVLDSTPAVKWGWELMWAIKQNPTTRDLPVVFYSLSEEQDLGSILELQYLAKPVGAEEMWQALVHQGIAASEKENERTLLIVDDEPHILELHTRMVKSHLPRCRVMTATGGRQALELMERCRPDLVLLDLMMPETDGFAVLRAMREREPTRDIPVIILTAQNLEGADLTRLQQGVASILSKGVFSGEQVLARIEAALARGEHPSVDAQRVVRRVMAHIHENYAQAITRQELARCARVSERHLNRCFQQGMGLAPMAYLTRYRLKQAKVLLELGQQNVSEIARTVGFSDANYFARVFREEVGLSPAAYRRGERV